MQPAPTSPFEYLADLILGELESAAQVWVDSYGNKQNEITDPGDYKSTLDQASRDALIYYLLKTRRERNLSSPDEGKQKVKRTSITPPVNDNQSRIRLGCPVSMFGALLRVMSDRQFFENQNTSELCRKVVASLSSQQAKQIGLKSLRNSFDDPEPETLERLLEELRVWVRYTEKFIDRQRR